MCHVGVKTFDAPTSAADPSRRSGTDVICGNFCVTRQRVTDMSGDQFLWVDSSLGLSDTTNPFQTPDRPRQITTY